METSLVNRIMKHKGAMVIALLVVTILAPCLVNPVQADVFAPTWLKRGVYAEYNFPAGIIHFPNESSSIGLGFDSYEFENGILRWECVDLVDTKATLDVRFDYTSVKYNGRPMTENKSAQLTSQIEVDTLSRATHLSNGTLLGTSHLWLPANPTPTDNIVLWDVSPDFVQSTVSNHSDIQVHSPQGTQNAFSIAKEAKVDNVTVLFNIMCFSKTGLMSQMLPVPVSCEPAFKALNMLSFDVNGIMTLTSTNIDLGPSSEPLNLTLILAGVVVIAVFAICLFAVYTRMLKKKKRQR